MKSLTRWLRETEKTTLADIILGLILGGMASILFYGFLVKVPDNPKGRVAYQHERVRMVAPVMAVMDTGKIVRIEK
jgi:fructose-specific phosphotransferase system IIC component